MSNFLIAAFIVFSISVITFSAVFFIAVRLRLLPAQPEVTELVDRLFSFNFFRTGHNRKKILIGTETSIWTSQFKQPRLLPSVFSTVAVVTIFVVPLPTPSTERVRLETGREKSNAATPYNEALVPETIVWEEEKEVA
jgi:hypothetical protein